ncbi:hypothetical protein ACQRAL_11690 [Lachnospiraceae bacterium SGI.231]
MKSSTVIITLGAAVAVGYAAYKLWKISNEDSSENAKTTTNSTPDIQERHQGKVELSTAKTLENAVENLEVEKTDIQNDIVQRHETAAKIMKNSINHILKEETPEVVSDNSNDLCDIEDALNKLLDE